MINDLYFNDLSLEGLQSIDQIEHFYHRLKYLVCILDLDCLPNLKFLIDVYSQRNLESDQPRFIELISGIRPEIRDYMFSQLNSSIFVDPHVDAPLYLFNLEQISLAVTYLNSKNEDAILFSFCSHENWDRTQLEFTREDGSELISLSNIGDIDQDTPWLSERLGKLLSYANATEFIEKIKPKFTNLLFNSSSLEQLKLIDTDIAKLERLERCFEILHDYCESDWSGSFRLNEINAKGVKLRGESQTTRDNGNYMNQRKFKDLEGNTLQFEYHFDVTKAERCYVLPLFQQKKILIGYIGEHLDTTRHN